VDPRRPIASEVVGLSDLNPVAIALAFKIGCYNALTWELPIWGRDEI